MATRMQQRRATAEQWLLADPILAAGEIGYETDTFSFKIGDGINTWSILDYFENSTSLQGTIDDYIPLTQKGVALGVAELDANGVVPASQLDLASYYTASEVDTEISTAVSGLVDSAPGVLDTLNELAAAIGDDANFVTTINASITSGDSATLTSAQSYADGLASNYDASGSAATAESNANSYTDSLVGDGTVDGTAGNTVTDRIAAKPDTLSDLSDTTISSASTGEALIYDGASWTNQEVVTDPMPQVFMMMGA